MEQNKQRDYKNNLRVEKLGYKVFRFWEHEIKKRNSKIHSFNSLLSN
ncbi:DUF559 domain-containing protein [Flavobacterium sp. DGU38]|uniref:DUF559 domain-containing protein n=1 Tax=Flavobacterium calami TaxID=3139144 RepID=A0ABU9IK29_9FLAO